MGLGGRVSVTGDSGLSRSSSRYLPCGRIRSFRDRRFRPVPETPAKLLPQGLLVSVTGDSGLSRSFTGSRLHWSLFP